MESPLVLLSNAFVAFLLNVAAVFLVGAGSGLVLTLAGVFKDILLITGSVLIFGTTITPLQVIGTAASVSSLCKANLSRCRLFDRSGRARLVQDLRQQIEAMRR